MSDYPVLDLSIMLGEKPVAVRCMDEWQVSCLISNGFEVCPERMGSWEIDGTQFSQYDKGDACYSFHDWINDPYGEIPVEEREYIVGNFGHCDIFWFAENGFDVIQFDTLMCPDNDLEESESIIESLFVG